MAVILTEHRARSWTPLSSQRISPGQPAGCGPQLLEASGVTNFTGALQSFTAGDVGRAAERSGAWRRVRYEAVPGRNLACLQGAAQ